MPYYTDTVTSFALLKSAIETYCVANGWTLADDILSKDSCFFKLTASTLNLKLDGGTSKTGSTLNGSPTNGVSIQSFSSYPITFPIRYFIHIFSNEVYIFINYNSSYYQHLSFGKSNLQGIGLGAWFTGSCNSNCYTSVDTFRHYFDINQVNVYAAANPSGGNLLVGMFCSYAISAAYLNPSYIYSSLDTTGWKNIGNSCSKVSGLFTALPNISNQATVLLPVKAILERSSGGITNLNTLSYCRLVRLDNHESESVITFGSDQWKVYPWYSRNVLARNGCGSNVDCHHSGTFGFAIRYEV